MDWVPVVFIIFKVLVFGTGMFFAIKWHYDQGKLGRLTERGAVLRVAGKVVLFAFIFVLLLVALLYATFAFSKKLGLDLTFP